MFDPTGADGRIHIPAMATHDVRLEIRAAGFVTRVVEVPAGSASFEAVLEKFGPAHRRRLAELTEEIRTAKERIDRATDAEEALHLQAYELQREAGRLRGE